MIAERGQLPPGQLAFLFGDREEEWVSDRDVMRSGMLALYFRVLQLLLDSRLAPRDASDGGGNYRSRVGEVRELL